MARLVVRYTATNHHTSGLKYDLARLLFTSYLEWPYHRWTFVIQKERFTAFRRPSGMRYLLLVSSGFTIFQMLPTLS